jgi:hypothetical protein
MRRRGFIAGLGSAATIPASATVTAAARGLGGVLDMFSSLEVKVLCPT